jgi:hypothetical protein
MVWRVLFVGIIALFVVGCEEKAMVNIYDKSLIKHPTKCLSLRLFPEDTAMKQALEKHMTFDPSCPYRLEVSYKNGIHCNSNQNSDRKALSAFPSSYLRMEIRRGMQLLYSYYIDLSQSAKPKDMSAGIQRILDDVVTH